jgi:hypothetical protein
MECLKNVKSEKDTKQIGKLGTDEEIKFFLFNKVGTSARRIKQ